MEELESVVWRKFSWQTFSQHLGSKHIYPLCSITSQHLGSKHIYPLCSITVLDYLHPLSNSVLMPTFAYLNHHGSPIVAVGACVTHHTLLSEEVTSRWNMGSFVASSAASSMFVRGGGLLLMVGVCLLTIELRCSQSIYVFIRCTRPLWAKNPSVRKQTLIVVKKAPDVSKEASKAIVSKEAQL